MRSPAGVLLTAGVWLLSALSVSALSTVVVDAGHGGHDRGGVPKQKLSEKIFTLKVAKKLETKLKAAGYKVVMTRTEDVYVSLPARCLIANRIRRCIFVSVHFDSYLPRRAANGITTYFTKSNSARLAAYVHREMLNALQPETNRGVKRARFYVVRNTLCPSILVEGGYLTNPTEAKKIQTDAYQEKLADAIVRGIIKYDKS